MTLFAYYTLLFYSFPTAIILLYSCYIYFVNKKRADDDPKKKNYNLFAVLLTPVTWPIFFLAGVIIFVLDFPVVILPLILSYLLLLILFLLTKTVKALLQIPMGLLQFVISKMSGHYFLKIGLFLFILSTIFDYLVYHGKYFSR